MGVSKRRDIPCVYNDSTIEMHIIGTPMFQDGKINDRSLRLFLRSGLLRPINTIPLPLLNKVLIRATENAPVQKRDMSHFSFR